jgi:perosamine synthetase
VARPVIGDLERRYVLKALEEGEVSSRGRFVTDFEERFAERMGARYGVATCNGTCALHLALLATGIGPGDEVLVPSLTFVATANAARYVDAQPVFVDIDSLHWNMDPDLLLSKITARTRAIVPVHLFGHSADMDTILEIANKHNLIVVEDAAEAHGAEYRGRPVGALGNAGVFSFYGNKILTTGEGGMVITNDPQVAEKARRLRDHGADPGRRYWHSQIGYNYRMTNLQAALGLAQLEQLDGFIRRKREIAELYRKYLGEAQGLTFQAVMDWASPVYWMVSLLVESRARVNRDTLMRALETRGIETRPFFNPIHLLPPYEQPGVRCPVAERTASLGLSLPSGASLKDGEVEQVATAVLEFCSKGPKPG